MKILFAGGGTGGHFYPLIAVARAIKKIADQEHIARIEFFMMSDDPVDARMLLDEEIKFIKIPAGKLRRYISIKNITDAFKTASGVALAFWRLYLLLPDVIFSKGGYASFPALAAARVLGIPVVIHESDSVPGKVSRWAGRWAHTIAISFPESARFFKGKNVVVAGNPIRPQVVGGNLTEAVQSFSLEEGVPTVLILGGSQGSERINETILAVLPDLVKTYQVIHQTGKSNFEDVLGRAKVLLEKAELKHRYHPYAFLAEGEYRNAAKAAHVVISRAGAGSIFEIAAWGIPSIIIPLPEDVDAQGHQRENAYNFARAGGCEVIEETNLKPHLVLSALDKILNDPEKIQKMKTAAESFARPGAADAIAKEVIKLGIHE